MSKINNQLNSLDQIKFVRDLTPEAAANYGGGAAFINSSNSPDVTVYKDTNSQGESLALNATSYDGFRNIGSIDGQSGHNSADIIKVPRPLFDRLRDLAIYAA